MGSSKKNRVEQDQAAQSATGERQESVDNPSLEAENDQSGVPATGSLAAWASSMFPDLNNASWDEYGEELFVRGASADGIGQMTAPVDEPDPPPPEVYVTPAIVQTGRYTWRVENNGESFVLEQSPDGKGLGHVVTSSDKEAYIACMHALTAGAASAHAEVLAASGAAEPALDNLALDETPDGGEHGAGLQDQARAAGQALVDLEEAYNPTKMLGRGVASAAGQAWGMAASAGETTLRWWSGEDIESTEAELAPEPTHTPEHEPEVKPTDQPAVVTDPSASLRAGPPSFHTVGGTLPLGLRVRIRELADVARANAPGLRVEYAHVEGEDGASLGWTLYSNLGSAAEERADWKADDQVDLSTLRGSQLVLGRIYNQKHSFLLAQANAIGIPVEAAAAVHKVESGGAALAGDGRTTVRFEVHKFYERWGQHNPTRFAQHFTPSQERGWTGHQFRQSPTSPWEDFHGSQAKEHAALDLARTLNDTAALESASYGAGQVMGFNFDKLGVEEEGSKYASVQEMYEAMCEPESNLLGLFEFIKSKGECVTHLSTGDYVAFAGIYNGSGQAEYYGGLIAAAAEAYRRVMEEAAHVSDS